MSNPWLSLSINSRMRLVMIFHLFFALHLIQFFCRFISDEIFVALFAIFFAYQRLTIFYYLIKVHQFCIFAQYFADAIQKVESRKFYNSFLSCDIFYILNFYTWIKLVDIFFRIVIINVFIRNRIFFSTSARHVKVYPRHQYKACPFMMVYVRVYRYRHKSSLSMFIVRLSNHK